MDIIGTIVFVGVALWLFMTLRREGDLTLPLMGYEALTDEILTAVKTDMYEIAYGEEKIGQRPGVHVRWDFTSLLAARLDAHEFPKSKIHDLKKKILGFIRMDPAFRQTEVAYDVERSFKFVAEYYDEKNKSWQKVD
ncbi:hypothetical protein [Mesorhizobium delmotii]|uniref:Uncharacterized protein n=1 Tax=Mesorhizobium delmotii TaxID=1631247 RepID=A0A2P9AU10_9HYPH|nr:hypothetical protein [Mesorhizobium delmotii]SJM34611.1 hypothetical protein BQ8482_480094 [Mesorhizobium delmotii]